MFIIKIYFLTYTEMNIKLEAILAVDENFGLSKNGIIPWKNKTDMTFFKTKTTGHTVIMGSNTLLSLPRGQPLPDRLNIVLTNDGEKYKNQYVGVDNIIFYDYLELIHYLKELDDQINNINENNIKDEINKPIYVIGGKQIYELLMPFCSKIWLTTIKGNYECDLFCRINMNKYVSEIIYFNESMKIQCLSSIATI